MRDGLNIDDPTSIAVIDAHGLPQRPKYNKGTRICRPLIVKLATISDKNKIFSHLKNLKNFDETRNSIVSCTTNQFMYPIIYPENLCFRRKGSIPNIKKLYLITRNHFGALRTVLTIYTSITLKFNMFMIMFIIFLCLFKFATCSMFFSDCYLIYLKVHLCVVILRVSMRVIVVI